MKYFNLLENGAQLSWSLFLGRHSLMARPPESVSVFWKKKALNCVFKPLVPFLYLKKDATFFVWLIRHSLLATAWHCSTQVGTGQHWSALLGTTQFGLAECSNGLNSICFRENFGDLGLQTFKQVLQGGSKCMMSLDIGSLGIFGKVYM